MVMQPSPSTSNIEKVYLNSDTCSGVSPSDMVIKFMFINTVFIINYCIINLCIIPIYLKAILYILTKLTNFALL